MAYDAEQRGHLVRKLVYEWVKTQRPDVLEEAQAEADKRFPPKKPRFSLPAGMKKLK